MSDETDLAAIEAAEAKPASQSADGVSETNRSAQDVIALQNHRRSLDATSPNNIVAALRGMRFKVVSPGGP